MSGFLSTMVGATFAAAATPTYSSAVVFDGSNDYVYLNNTSNLTTSNSYSGFFWINVASTTSGFILEDFRNGIFAVRAELDAGIIRIRTENPGGTYWFHRSSPSISTNTWYAIWYCFNAGNTNNRGAWIQQYNSSTVTAFTSVTNNTGTYQSGYYDATKNLGIGGRGANGAVKVNGKLAEFWMDNSNVSFDTAANRQKFVTSAGLPVSLGTDGSTPFGSKPDVYLRGTAANWATNFGDLGQPTIVGALTDASLP